MGEIAEYLKARDAVYNSKQPLQRPKEMDDPKATPEQRTAAAERYASQLLQRKTLTPEETLFLGTEIARHLRGE